jgi:hypothetical protein
MKTAIIAILFIAVVVGALYANYWVWSAAHPDAPLWTYFLLNN